MNVRVLVSLATVLLGVSLSAQVIAIPVFSEMESSSSWKSKEDACTYGIQRARTFAKRECRRAHGGEPKSYEANCPSYRQVKSGEWKAIGNVILQCKLDD